MTRFQSIALVLLSVAVLVNAVVSRNHRESGVHVPIPTEAIVAPGGPPDSVWHRNNAGEDVKVGDIDENGNFLPRDEFTTDVTDAGLGDNIVVTRSDGTQIPIEEWGDFHDPDPPPAVATQEWVEQRIKEHCENGGHVVIGDSCRARGCPRLHGDAMSCDWGIEPDAGTVDGSDDASAFMVLSDDLDLVGPEIEWEESMIYTTTTYDDWIWATLDTENDVLSFGGQVAVTIDGETTVMDGRNITVAPVEEGGPCGDLMSAVALDKEHQSILDSARRHLKEYSRLEFLKLIYSKTPPDGYILRDGVYWHPEDAP